MSASSGILLNLRSAAAELGVHYQTAYGWVRSGRLSADFVEGRYLVGRDDLDNLKLERSTPRSPKPPAIRRLERTADRMHEALLAGDESTVRQLAVGLVAKEPRSPI